MTEYQPRTPERLVEILRAQGENPRSWQAEAAAEIARLTAERDDAAKRAKQAQCCDSVINSVIGNLLLANEALMAERDAWKAKAEGLEMILVNHRLRGCILVADQQKAMEP